MLEFSFWQWLLLGLGAFLIGLSKTGVAGLAAFAVAIFANLIPARLSTGIVLPLLICADIIAVRAYRRHAVWSAFLNILPWFLVGTVLGHQTMGRMQDLQVQHLIGWILLVMVTLHVWRLHRKDGPPPRNLWLPPLVGILAGFCSLMANAAGPIMILYFLALRLPKMEFLGTMAWTFLLLNMIKVPFVWNLGLIHTQTLKLNLLLAPLVILGAFWGRRLIEHINQRLFEQITLACTVFAGLRLVLV